MAIPDFAHNLLLSLPPRYSRHYQGYLDWRWGPPDLRFVPDLCNPKKASIDVGANVGKFTHVMAKHSARVYAFEPNPDLAALLAAKRFPRTQIFNEALSDAPDTLPLRIPITNGAEDHGRATIETANTFENYREVSVPITRLDDRVLDDIGFIKIDVEGHELGVLQGAQRLLSACKPNILMELNDQHNPGVFERCIDYMAGLGYKGHFHWRGSVLPIQNYDASVHRKPESYGTADWITTFIFQS